MNNKRKFVHNNTQVAMDNKDKLNIVIIIQYIVKMFVKNMSNN